jgi:hypothetical protein
VLALHARSSVGAAVVPGQPLQLEPDAQLGGVEVDVGPAQAERLTLPETAGQPDRPAGGVAAACYGLQDRSGLPLAERGLGGLAQPRGLDKLAGIAGDVAPPDFDLIGARQDGVNLANRGLS